MVDVMLEMRVISFSSSAFSCMATDVAGLMAGQRHENPMTILELCKRGDLSYRSAKACQRLHVETLAQLSAKTEMELLDCRNFGAIGVRELNDLLEKNGYPRLKEKKRRL